MHEVGHFAIEAKSDSDDPMQAEIGGIALALGPNDACYVPLSHKQSGDGSGLFAAGLAPDQIGAAEALLHASVDYAKQRTQFGRVIGSYQAIKHKLADAHIAIELARPLVYGAALSLDARDVSAAKAAATPKVPIAIQRVARGGPARRYLDGMPRPTPM